MITHTFCLIFLSLFFLNRAVYKRIWKNIAEPDRPQMTMCCMCIACWIPKTTNTHSEYAILIDLPLQQWLHESASMLRLVPIIISIFYDAWCAVMCTGEITHTITRILTTSFCALNFTLPACRPNFAKVARTTHMNERACSTHCKIWCNMTGWLTFWRRNYFFLILAHPIYIKCE